MRKYYLAILVWWNYRQRRLGKLPDVWYWADRELLAMGYVVGKYPYPIIFAAG